MQAPYLCDQLFREWERERSILRGPDRSVACLKKTQLVDGVTNARPHTASILVAEEPRRLYHYIAAGALGWYRRLARRTHCHLAPFVLTLDQLSVLCLGEVNDRTASGLLPATWDP